MTDSSPADARDQKIIAVTIAAVGILLILLFAVVSAFIRGGRRPPSVTLPGGITYLGQTPTPLPSPTGNAASIPAGQFKADRAVAWKIYTGNTYPYRFSYPVTLPIAAFPDDPSDAAAVNWGAGSLQEKVLLSVIDISQFKILSAYVKEPKIGFAQNWWREFSGLSGVATVSAFTNGKGMKGYRAIYINSAGQTPNVDIFFEVPQNPKLVIRIANGVLDPALFDKIVDSVEWKK